MTESLAAIGVVGIFMWLGLVLCVFVFCISWWHDSGLGFLAVLTVFFLLFDVPISGITIMIYVIIGIGWFAWKIKNHINQIIEEAKTHNSNIDKQPQSTNNPRTTWNEAVRDKTTFTKQTVVSRIWNKLDYDEALFWSIMWPLSVIQYFFL